MKSRAARIGMGVALAAALGVTACDRSPVDPPGHQLLGTVVIIDRTVTPRADIATWTHDGGWDTDVLMTLSHATEDHRTRTSLGARMYTRGGDEIELSGEHSLRYGVQSDPDNVLDMDETLGLFHGDHVHIYGHHEDGTTGTAQIVFALWHVDHSDGETDPIAITITD